MIINRKGTAVSVLKKSAVKHNTCKLCLRKGTVAYSEIESREKELHYEDR